MFAFHDPAGYGLTRALEASLALLMISCGMVLLWPGETFSLPHYDVLKRFISEAVGGMVLVGAGLFRAAAIWINGRKTPTPLWRLVGCAIGAAFWFAMFLSMEEAIRSGDATAPPLMLGVAFAAFASEFYSGLRAGADVSHLQSLSGVPRVARWLRPR